MDFLERKGRHPLPKQNRGYFPDWDIEDEEFTYEVKLDRKHCDTGNFYIEQKSLFNSRADYLVYLFEEQGNAGQYFIAIAPSAKVRNAYRKLAKFREVRGGDFRELGILLNSRDFETIFCLIGYVPKMHFKTGNPLDDEL